MSVIGQTGNPESVLSMFLQSRLPQRDVVAWDSPGGPGHLSPGLPQNGA